MLMPLIPELPENLTFDPETDPAVSGDVVDLGEDSNEETLLLEGQAKIAGLTKLLMMSIHMIQNEKSDWENGHVFNKGHIKQ